MECESPGSVTRVAGQSIGEERAMQKKNSGNMQKVTLGSQWSTEYPCEWRKYVWK